LTKRATDADVNFVSYIRIDIDVVINFDGNVNTEMIKTEIVEHLAEQLENSPFALPSYIVFSGKGLHYYLC